MAMRKFKLPEPESFQAIYRNKSGGLITVTAPPLNYEKFFPHWEISEKERRLLVKNGIIPKRIEV